MTEKETGWQFYPIKIIGVAGDEETAKDIVEKLVNPILERDASEGKGLFANVTEIEMEDEDEDDLLMVEIYNCKASLTAYWEDLKRFGVISRGKSDAFFSYQFRGLLLKVLNELATYISQNTNKPAKTKNHITETVKEFDNMPIWGLFFQILILQGLCKWLLTVNINEGDNGYNEAQSLYDWLQEALGEKLIWFCFVQYSDNDKIRLKPLTDYLYSTKIGQLVQRTIFSKDRQANNEGRVTLPEELNTEEAITLSRESNKNKHKGRPKRSLKDNMICEDPEAMLSKLHKLIDGKKGRDVALIITACIKMGAMTRPTFKQVQDEFGNIGNRQGYNKYMDAKYSFTVEEVEPILTVIKEQ